jgi:hypothetical protein
MGAGTAWETVWTGWLVAALLAVQIGLPFFLRRVRKGGVKGEPSDAGGSPLLGASMRWHYLLGFILPAAALAHGWIPMGSGHMPHTNMTGLWLATYALGLLFLQLVIGLTVQRVRVKGLRRVHFFTMLVVAALAISHMLLN